MDTVNAKFELTAALADLRRARERVARVKHDTAVPRATADSLWFIEEEVGVVIRRVQRALRELEQEAA